jgi:hypothetical protein
MASIVWVDTVEKPSNPGPSILPDMWQFESAQLRLVSADRGYERDFPTE